MSLIIGLGGVSIAVALGIFISVMAGWDEGWWDEGLMRLMDGLSAFPSLLLALAPVAITGGPLVNIILVLGIVGAPWVARVIRSQVLSIREREFILAVLSLGTPPWRIMFKHLVPNCLAPVIVQANLSIASAILLEASLSFLGVGVKPPTPTWDGMLRHAPPLCQAILCDFLPSIAKYSGTWNFHGQVGILNSKARPAGPGRSEWMRETTVFAEKRHGMKRLSLLIVVLVTSLASALAQGTETLRSDHVRVSWLAPQVFGPSTEMIGIRFELQPGWHIYWKNPGDSGAAPKFMLSATGASFGAIQWPYPTRLPFMHLTNLGYEGAVVFPFAVQPQGGDSLQIEAQLEWLVCEEECIPGFGTLTLQRPLDAAGPRWVIHEQESLEQARRMVPGAAEEASWRITSTQLRAGALQVSLVPTASPWDTPTLFPVDGEVLAPGAPRTEKTVHGVNITLDVIQGRPLPERLSYVLVEGDRAWEFNDVPVSIATPPSAGVLPVPVFLGLVLGSAFAGGLLLNFMPCVFPVLAIKLLKFVRAEQAQAERWREGLWYTGGVLTTFLALGAVLLALRSAGAVLGWGFQLQSPVMVLLLVVVFWVMALNLLGVFEFGLRIMNFAGRQGVKRQAGESSSFATGALAVFVAAPCTGPFMGSALGAAATLPAHQAMAIFLGLGLGFAAPLLVFARIPAAAAYMPKAGPWMETFKHICAFPLFATVVWLLWVLGLQTGTDGWLVAAVLLLAVSFSLWLGRFTSRVTHSLAWLLAVVMLFYSGAQVRSMPAAGTEPPDSAWAAYDSAALASAQARGQAVFVDFTAAWCITCQVNKKVVLETSAVSALFRAHNVRLMRGDWTRKDPVITEALVQFGRNSVPLYIFYAADGSAPRVLPQILTLSVMKTLFNP